jgi:hypothetical protein
MCKLSLAQRVRTTGHWLILAAALLLALLPGCASWDQEQKDLNDAASGVSNLLRPAQGAITPQGRAIEDNLQR